MAHAWLHDHMAHSQDSKGHDFIQLETVCVRSECYEIDIIQTQ